MMTTTAPGAGWDDWTGAEAAELAAPAAVTATSPPGPPPGGGWEDWTNPPGGGGDSGSPIAIKVRCPITWDASAAQITLPEPQKPGYSVVAEVCIDGGLTVGELPGKRGGVRLLDGTTVLVSLTGAGPVAHGPEYAPPAYPGGKKTPVPVPPGTPYVLLVVYPADGGMGGGQPIKQPPGMKGGQR